MRPRPREIVLRVSYRVSPVNCASSRLARARSVVSRLRSFVSVTKHITAHRQRQHGDANHVMRRDEEDIYIGTPKDPEPFCILAARRQLNEPDHFHQAVSESLDRRTKASSDHR